MMACENPQTSARTSRAMHLLVFWYTFLPQCVTTFRIFAGLSACDARPLRQDGLTDTLQFLHKHSTAKHASHVL